MDLSIDSLKECSFFSSFAENQLLEIFNKLEKVDLQEGEYLFKQNEKGDSLYVLIKGKLIVEEEHKNIKRTIGFVRLGETVGELTLFSNEPRSASVRALYPSTLMRLQRDDFQQFCYHHPQILWQETILIANRSQATIRNEMKNIARIIALVTVGTQIDTKTVYNELKKLNTLNLKINFIDSETINNSSNSYQLFKEALEHGNSVIYTIQGTDLEEKHEILKHCDKVIIVINPDQNDFPSLKQLWDKLIEKNTHQIEKELMLLHEEPKTHYPNTDQFLGLSRFSKHYHVCFKSPITIQRMLRALTGNSLGLVLSGGGAKGWATVGALKAFYEKGICIDYIGGTSIGSAVAIMYALTESFDQLFDLYKSQLQFLGSKPVSFRHLTLPLVSLNDGKKGTAVAKRFCNDIKIEDLSLPYYAISTNLSSYCETIWDRGYLWEATRASGSIPVAVPPFVHQDQLHIDGGILNNFPVDVMVNRLENKGYIIGIDISASSIDTKKYFFPPSISFWDSIKIKLGITKTSRIGIFEIIQRLIATAGVDKANQNAKKCDLLIKPPLDAYSMLDFSKGAEMMELGYKEASKILSESPLSQLKP